MTPAASADIISARSGEAVLLSSNLTEAGLRHVQDVRWTHIHLLMSLKNNETTCDHGRCQLLPDGSLRFSRVQTEDSGSYRLQVFEEGGNRVKTKDFLLRVDAGESQPDMLTSLLPTMTRHFCNN